MKNWHSENPEIRSIRVAAPDLNGIARGKRLPPDMASKVGSGDLRFPLSVMNLDLWGNDIEDSPLVFQTGDADGVLHPTERGFLPMPWLKAPTALLPVCMHNEDGTPFAGDPRHALAQVVERYQALGLTPVSAVELEFYLLDDSGAVPCIPVSPRSGKRRAISETMSLQALDRYESYLNDLYDACATMDIPADTAISECGMGQFEINLKHGADALKAADDAWLFKMLAKGLARKHGFAASFMAKPYPDQAGSGLHVHFSVLDAAGTNIFDDGTDAGSDRLRHAIAGCMAAMHGSTLIFAPHANSYSRLVPHSHAPTGVAWAYENRTAAIRVPAGSGAARRIEHRTAGGDVNPYLMLAAVLGAALNGLEDAALPPAPITGNAYGLDLPQIAETWSDALTAFRHDPHVARIFPPDLISNLALTKAQEIRTSAAMDADELHALTLDLL